MLIDIQSKELELTDAIRTYAEEKVSMLEKYYDHIEKVSCVLEATSHKHHHGRVYACSGHLIVPGKDFFVEKEEEDLYKAIDSVKDHLQELLVEWKKKQKGNGGEKLEIVSEEDEEEAV